MTELTELTGEAEHKRFIDARRQLVIHEVVAKSRPGDDQEALERLLVRELARSGDRPPTQDWVIAVATAISTGHAYVVSPQSEQDAEAMRRGEFPPPGWDRPADAVPLAAGGEAIDDGHRPAPAVTAVPAPEQDRDTRALIVAGVALLVALWAFRSRRR